MPHGFAMGRPLELRERVSALASFSLISLAVMIVFSGFYTLPSKTKSFVYQNFVMAYVGPEI